MTYLRFTLGVVVLTVISLYPTCIRAKSDVQLCLSKYRCLRYCPYGYVLDKYGCKTCICKPKPICPPLFQCFKLCPHGFVTDKNGCRICACKNLTSSVQKRIEVWLCSPLLCHRYCPNGFVTDKFGCQTCTCKQPQQ